MDNTKPYQSNKPLLANYADGYSLVTCDFKPYGITFHRCLLPNGKIEIAIFNDKICDQRIIFNGEFTYVFYSFGKKWSVSVNCLDDKINLTDLKEFF